MVFTWSIICCTIFLNFGSSLPCGSEVNALFNFYETLLISFWFFFLGGPLLGMVLGSMGFTFGGNPERIISLHGMKGIHCWSELLVPTEYPSLSIEFGHLLKLSKNNCSSSGHSLEAKLFFTGPKSGTFFYYTSIFWCYTYSYYYINK